MSRLKTTQMKFFRRSAEYTLSSQKTNEEFFGELVIELLINYMAYGTWRFNAAFTRALQ